MKLNVLSPAMARLLQSEEILSFLFALYLFNTLNYSWWLFIALFFTPDVSMVGYLFGPKIGAWMYNLIHHKGVALILIAFGILINLPWIELIGIILFAHASFDRILGYGLKYESGFKKTHLGEIGK
jgi:hypothetical protein